MVPVSLEKQLMPGTLEYAIHHVLEERLDLSSFEELYSNDKTGHKAIAPKILIKAFLLVIQGDSFHPFRWSEPVTRILLSWLRHETKSLIIALRKNQN
jgi:hypothetical protein